MSARSDDLTAGELVNAFIAREQENGHHGWATFTCLTYEAQCVMFQECGMKVQEPLGDGCDQPFAGELGYGLVISEDLDDFPPCPTAAGRASFTSCSYPQPAKQRLPGEELERCGGASEGDSLRAAPPELPSCGERQLRLTVCV